MEAILFIYSEVLTQKHEEMLNLVILNFKNYIEANDSFERSLREKFLFQVVSNFYAIDFKLSS